MYGSFNHSSGIGSLTGRFGYRGTNPKSQRQTLDHILKVFLMSDLLVRGKMMQKTNYNRRLSKSNLERVEVKFT